MSNIMITESQYVNNYWITYHKSKPKSNKMQGLMSLMFDFPTFCMNNRTNCKSICKNCYAYIQSSIRGKSLWPKLRHNTEVFSNSMVNFDPITSPLNILRFSSYGELSNNQQLLNIILTAKSNKHLHTALWTKRYNIVKGMIHLIPSNLILVWSASQINSMKFVIPKGFHKSFYVYKDEQVLSEAANKATSQGFNVIHCKKICKDCLHCYTNKNQSIIMEIIK